MSNVTQSNIDALIDEFCRNYPQEFFHNMSGNRILKMITAWIASGGTTGPVINPGMTLVTSANFSTTVDCPIPLLAGQSLAILWVDPPKPLIKGTDWVDLAGGGFTMTVPGFDSTASTYTFWVYITT